MNCFGIWKRRFTILSVGTRFQTIEKTLPIIVATAILHNIAQQEIILAAINLQIYNNAILQTQHIDNTHINNKRDTILEYFNK